MAVVKGLAARPWAFPRWVAHRGAGRLAPENTLAAFRVGASHGFRAFECDVKLSSDGVPFLLHDSTLPRTTSGHGLAAALPWSELSRLDAGAWHSPRFAGEPPASLAGIAAFCLANEFALDLEIKPTPGAEAETGEAVAEHAARLWHGRQAPLLLSSFQAASLSAAQATEPSLARALLLDALRPGWLDEARTLGCAAVVFNYSIIDRSVIAACNAAGLRSLVYTVNDPAGVAHASAAGVDGLITDAVDRITPAAPHPG